jgi:hypothetical protein
LTAGRVSTLEVNQGGTTLSAHRSAPVLDHPDGSVTTNKLADNAVTAPKLAHNAVTAIKIADRAVIASKIAEGAVTLQKLADTAFSANPTPNTLVIRNDQGAVQDGVSIPGSTVQRVNGIYSFQGVNRWLKIAEWTGISGSYKGLFADLYIVRVAEHNLAARIRARLGRSGSGDLLRPMLSLANDYLVSGTNGIVTDAILLETGQGTYELWLNVWLAPIYVTGVVGVFGAGAELVLTPYGDVSVQDSAPTPVSGGLYLEWATATVEKTLLGPGYIVAASRTPSGYIRYDNGVQVAWGTITVGNGTWTYPAAFASTPQVQATAQTANGAPRVVTLTDVSITAAGILQTDLSGNVQSGTVHLYAVGLWK